MNQLGYAPQTIYGQQPSQYQQMIDELQMPSTEALVRERMLGKQNAGMGGAQGVGDSGIMASPYTKAAMTAAQMGLGAIRDKKDRYSTQNQVTGAASGALSGAATGSMAGPWGTAIGAVIGGLAGLLGNRKH